MDLRVKNLRKILDINKKINSTLDINELLTLIMNAAAEVMNTEAASLLMLDEESQELSFKVALGDKGAGLVEKSRVKVGEGIVGHVAKGNKSLIVNDTKSDKRFAKRFDKSTGFQSEAIICVPVRSKGKVIGVLEALNPIGRKIFTKDDLELFEAFAEQAAIAIEKAQLHAEIVKQEKAKYELKIASEIQTKFLPDFSEQNFIMDLFAKTVPAREVGGDFYDVLTLGDNKLGLLIADVSGKGVPAALLMINAITHFRFLAPSYHSPSTLFEKLNKIITRDSAMGMFITALYVIIDPQNLSLEYTCAGHHPVLKRSKNGKVEELDNVGGGPLGFDADAKYSKDAVPVAPGDTLFLYTDGIIEARNSKGKEYHLQGLINCIRGRSKNASTYTQHIFKNINKFAKGVNQHDDMTVLTVTIPNA